MANIKLNGQDYYNVDKVVLPTVEGGMAEFGGTPNLQNKQVTITTNTTTTIEADSGYYGLGEVEVITNVSSGGNNKLPDFIEGSMTAIIPTDLQGATKIDDYGIYFKLGLLSISLPSSIKEIGGSGITNCNDLEEITVAEGTETLGQECFAYNVSLTTVHLPSTIIDEGDNENLRAFYGCENLSDVYYNSTQADWETIDPNKDLFGSGLEQQITVHCTDGNIVINEPIGNMVVTLTDDTVINIPVPVKPLPLETYAQQYEFDAGQTKSVVFPSGVLEISAFFANGCTDLTSVTFPNTLVKIGKGAFSGTALSNIDLPDTIETIESMAFANLQSASATLTCRATTTPLLGYNALEPLVITAIYVPSASVTDYQQDTNWSRYASIIQAIV